MNNVSKKKIAAGYAVLLAVLLYSLFFVHREMENLMSSDNSDILRTDSLIGLLVSQISLRPPAKVSFSAIARAKIISSSVSFTKFAHQFIKFFLAIE